MSQVVVWISAMVSNMFLKRSSLMFLVSLVVNFAMASDIEK